MDPDTVGQVIAERRYKLSTKSDLNEEVIVRLGAPQQSPGNGPFFCPFEIAGFGGARIKRIFGADAFQALQLTLKIIGAHLHYYRQSYGPGFYMDEEGDDLGFPAEAWTKGLGHRIATTLDPISGLKLSIARNAASMKNFQFGEIGPDADGKGIVGQWALHIQCPWRIVTAQCAWRIPTANLLATGSADWWEPGDQDDNLDPDEWSRHRPTPSLQEKLLAELFQKYDPETKSYFNVSDQLVVEQIDADDYGGVDIHLSGNYRLQVFPDGKRGEHWRFFDSRKDGRHFVMQDGKLDVN